MGDLADILDRSEHLGRFWLEKVETLPKMSGGINKGRHNNRYKPLADILKDETPPALEAHLKNFPHVELDFIPKTVSSPEKESTNTISDNSEWIILPKNSSMKQRSSLSDTGISRSIVTEIARSKKDNCLVSPIFLKKKNKYSSSADADVLKLSSDIPVILSVGNPKNNIKSSHSNNFEIVSSMMDEFSANTGDCSSDCVQDTPLRMLRSNTASTNENNNSTPKRLTPKGTAGRSTRSARKRLDLTPSSTVKRPVGHGFLTPIISEKNSKQLIKDALPDLDKARINLQASTLPESLPCRSDEYNNIRTYVLRNILDKSGGCMYISGVPGTGKTATVHAVMKSLQKDSMEKIIPGFDFVEVNGLRLTEPRQCYVRIWQTLTGNKVIMELALKNLEKKFEGRPQRSTVILLDELDYLCNKRQDVIYNLLEWTTKQHSRLVILTIANTMDLPERTLKGKITSRMGLTRLVFQPYTYQQLQQIVMNRLGSYDKFHPDAVQLVARKVAAISGDARRALEICRRAIENFENDPEKTITVFDIEKVISSIFTGVRVQAIKNCSLMGKLILRAIRDEVYRTGVEETTFRSVYNQVVTICSLEGTFQPNTGEAVKLCKVLADYGLIVMDKHRADLNRRISLNVSPDDIHYALNC